MRQAFHVTQSLLILVAFTLWGVPVCRAWSATPDCTTAGCHDQLAKRQVLHEPVATGQCDACHRKIDGTEHSFTMIRDSATLCAGCHDDAVPLAAQAARGGVVAQCTICHDPHGSGHKGHLVADKASLCQSCHPETEAWTEPGRTQHGGITRDCTACHAPHGSAYAPALVKPMPELCLDCHDDIRQAVASATVEHKAWTMDRHCANCHEPHSAKLEYLLRQEPKELCLQCHDKPLQSGTETIPDFAALLRERPHHHGPIRDGNCSGCHTKVHGGSARYRLEKDMPQDFYVPYDAKSYALCFQCHDEHITADSRTATFTGFRNGEQNLHFLHVNRRNKGRNCQVCHDVHAANREDQIVDATTFGPGGWKLPIRFDRTATGGSCETGCHRRYRYDRLNPATNPASATTPTPLDGGGR